MLNRIRILFLYIFIFVTSNLCNAAVDFYTISPAVSTAPVKYLSELADELEVRFIKTDSAAAKHGLNASKKVSAITGSGMFHMNKDGLGRDLDYWAVIDMGDYYGKKDVLIENLVSDIVSYVGFYNESCVSMKSPAVYPVNPKFDKVMIELKQELIRNYNLLKEPNKDNKIAYRDPVIFYALSNSVKYNKDMFAAIRKIDITFVFDAKFHIGDNVYTLLCVPHQAGPHTYNMFSRALSSLLIGKESLNYIVTNFPRPYDSALLELRISLAENLILLGKNYIPKRPIKAIKRFHQAYDMMKPAFSVKEQKYIESTLKGWFDSFTARYVADISSLLRALESAKKAHDYDAKTIEKTIVYLKMINKDLARKYDYYESDFSGIYNTLKYLKMDYLPVSEALYGSIYKLGVRTGPSKKELLRMKDMLYKRFMKLPKTPSLLEQIKEDSKNFRLSD